MLFWMIVAFLAIMGVCFLTGEYLQDCRIAKKRREECAKQSETLFEETVPEVTPTPHQAAQMLSHDVEQLAQELADRFGLDVAHVQDYFKVAAANCPLPDHEKIVDLDEQPPLA